MSRFFLLFSVLFTLSFCAYASGKNVHVNSVTGVDIADCGCSSKPCLTIPYALDLALTDDILVLRGHFRLTSAISLSKNVGLTGGQNTNSPAILDCGKRDQSAVFIGKSLKTSLSNLIIQNCHSHSSSALQIFDADVVLHHVIFKNNKRWRGNGGAMAILGGKVEIRSGVFQKNTAMVQNGGAIACQHGCQLNLIDSLVIENEAKNTAGGIFISNSHLIAERVTIGGNSAKTAGGLFSILGGSVTTKDCKFEENISTEEKCSQVLLKSGEGSINTFSTTTFISNPSSTSTSEESTEKGVCFEKTKVQFIETSFARLGISCSDAEFSFEESHFYEMAGGKLPISCGRCSGWVGGQKVCKKV